MSPFKFAILLLTTLLPFIHAQYPPQIPQALVTLADGSQQLLGDGGINMDGCFTIMDNLDPLMQLGVVNAKVTDRTTTLFFYTEEECVRESRIFRAPVQAVDFRGNPLLARSVRIVSNMGMGMGRMGMGMGMGGMI